MDAKKDRRNVRKIEVPRDTATEFELGDIAPDIQRKREEREQRERESRHRNNRGRTGRGGSQEDRNYTVTDRGGSG